MTRREVLEKVIRISNELSDIHFAKRMVEAAKTKDEETFNKLIDRMQKYKLNTYNEIIELGKTINELINSHNKSECLIFSDREKKEQGVVIFDANIYDSLSILIISFLGNFEVGNLFENWGCSDSTFVFIEHIACYKRLSKFVVENNYHKFYKKYSNLYDFVVDIFDGKYD